MKTNSLISIILASLFIQLFTSCTKDDDIAKPTITIHELGVDNSKTVVAGDDLHLDVEVLAPGKINKITLSIHQESGLKNVNIETVAWEFEQVYTLYKGQKNADFHQDVKIPFDTPAGIYHLHISVVDMEGNETTAEDEFEITTPVF